MNKTKYRLLFEATWSNESANYYTEYSLESLEMVGIFKKREEWRPVYGYGDYDFFGLSCGPLTGDKAWAKSMARHYKIDMPKEVYE